jgi:hypothetical protein
MMLLFSSLWPHTRFLTVPNRTGEAGYAAL